MQNWINLKATNDNVMIVKSLFLSSKATSSASYAINLSAVAVIPKPPSKKSSSHKSASKRKFKFAQIARKNIPMTKTRLCMIITDFMF